MINIAQGISFSIDLGLSGWPHELERTADRNVLDPSGP